MVTDRMIALVGYAHALTLAYSAQDACAYVDAVDYMGLALDLGTQALDLGATMGEISIARECARAQHRAQRVAIAAGKLEVAS